MQNQKLRVTLAQTQGIVQQLQQEVMGLRQAVGFQGEVIGALVATVGEDLVGQEIDRLRAERQAKAEAQQAEGVKAMVEQGILKPVEVVSVKSFIIGQDIIDAPEGQPAQRPSRQQFELANVKPEKQADYLGKKVGDAVIIKSEQPGAPSGKFVITEVYDIDVVQAVKNAQKAQQAAAGPAENKPSEPVPFVDEPASPPPPAPADEEETADEDVEADKA
jgi:hypothetical protein